MKFIAASFVFLLAGINALPQDWTQDDEQQRITSSIQQIIENLSQRIVDPLEIPYYSTEIVTPIGWAEAWIHDLECSGQSRTRIDRLSWSPITSRLIVDIVWPRIGCEKKSVGAQAVILGQRFSATKSGSVTIKNLRAQVDIRVIARPGIGGINITLRDCDVILSAHITSDLTVKVQGKDLSEKYNRKVEKINSWLHQNRDEISDSICEAIGAALRAV